MKKLAGFIFVALLSCWLVAPASAQICNDPSGFIKTEGPINVGDILTLGPDCQHVQSGGNTGILFSNGFFLGSVPNIQIVPGNPLTGPGGNVFDGGIIDQHVFQDYQTSAYHLDPTSGLPPAWGPITELVAVRTSGTNFQRISFSTMGAFADQTLGDVAVDYRIQAESGGAAALLPIKFTQQQNTLGTYFEYLTLASGGNGNVRMFRRIDGAGQTANLFSFTLGQQKRGTVNVLTAAGTQDSPQFIVEGAAFDTALHTASFKQYVAMTSNAGAGTWHLQYALDAGAYADLFTCTSAGICGLNTLNATAVNAATLTGALNANQLTNITTPVVCLIVSTAAVTCNNGTAYANAGTFTTPIVGGITARYLKIRMVGGGAGGAGGGTAPGTGVAGGSAVFSTLTATGGAIQAGAGGTGTNGYLNMNGGAGGGGPNIGVQSAGGPGGVSGCGFGSSSFGVVNGVPTAPGGFGNGGAGGGSSASTNPGAGGSAGGCLEAIISAPAATYSYTIGATGTAGAAGANGQNGSAGTGPAIEIVAAWQ